MRKLALIAVIAAAFFFVGRGQAEACEKIGYLTVPMGGPSCICLSGFDCGLATCVEGSTFCVGIGACGNQRACGPDQETLRVTPLGTNEGEIGSKLVRKEQACPAKNRYLQPVAVAYHA